MRYRIQVTDRKTGTWDWLREGEGKKAWSTMHFLWAEAIVTVEQNKLAGQQGAENRYTIVAISKK